jgi:hypothetical protein
MSETAAEFVDNLLKNPRDYGLLFADGDGDAGAKHVLDALCGIYVDPIEAKVDKVASLIAAAAAKLRAKTNLSTRHFMFSSLSSIHQMAYVNLLAVFLKSTVDDTYRSELANQIRAEFAVTKFGIPLDLAQWAECLLCKLNAEKTTRPGTLELASYIFAGMQDVVTAASAASNGDRELLAEAVAKPCIVEALLFQMIRPEDSASRDMPAWWDDFVAKKAEWRQDASTTRDWGEELIYRFSVDRSDASLAKRMRAQVAKKPYLATHLGAMLASIAMEVESLPIVGKFIPLSSFGKLYDAYAATFMVGVNIGSVASSDRPDHRHGMIADRSDFGAVPSFVPWETKDASGSLKTYLEKFTTPVRKMTAALFSSQRAVPAGRKPTPRELINGAISANIEKFTKQIETEYDKDIRRPPQESQGGIKHWRLTMAMFYGIAFYEIPCLYMMVECFDTIQRESGADDDFLAKIAEFCADSAAKTASAHDVQIYAAAYSDVVLKEIVETLQKYLDAAAGESKRPGLHYAGAYSAFKAAFSAISRDADLVEAWHAYNRHVFEDLVGPFARDTIETVGGGNRGGRHEIFDPLYVDAVREIDSAARYANHSAWEQQRRFDFCGASSFAHSALRFCGDGKIRDRLKSENIEVGGLSDACNLLAEAFARASAHHSGVWVRKYRQPPANVASSTKPETVPITVAMDAYLQALVDTEMPAPRTESAFGNVWNVLLSHCKTVLERFNGAIPGNINAKYFVPLAADCGVLGSRAAPLAREDPDVFDYIRNAGGDVLQFLAESDLLQSLSTDRAKRSKLLRADEPGYKMVFSIFGRKTERKSGYSNNLLFLPQGRKLLERYEGVLRGEGTSKKEAARNWAFLVHTLRVAKDVMRSEYHVRTQQFEDALGNFGVLEEGRRLYASLAYRLDQLLAYEMSRLAAFISGFQSTAVPAVAQLFGAEFLTAYDHGHKFKGLEQNNDRPIFVESSSPSSGGYELAWQTGFPDAGSAEKLPDAPWPEDNKLAPGILKRSELAALKFSPTVADFFSKIAEWILPKYEADCGTGAGGGGRASSVSNVCFGRDGPQQAKLAEFLAMLQAQSPANFGMYFNRAVLAAETVQEDGGSWLSALPFTTKKAGSLDYSKIAMIASRVEDGDASDGGHDYDDDDDDDGEEDDDGGSLPDEAEAAVDLSDILSDGDATTVVTIDTVETIGAPVTATASAAAGANGWTSEVDLSDIFSDSAGRPGSPSTSTLHDNDGDVEEEGDVEVIDLDELITSDEEN